MFAFEKVMNAWHDGTFTRFGHGCMKYFHPQLHNASRSLSVQGWDMLNMHLFVHVLCTQTIVHNC